MSSAPGRWEEPVTLKTLRLILLATLALGLVGTGVELLLLEHTEDYWQLVPLVLIGGALLVLAWHAVDRRARSTRAIRAMMLLFVVSGIVGLVLHYQGNVEFEREMYPGLGGTSLFRQAMSGATPALAPGMMIQLALLGLAYTFRHPALTTARESATSETTGR
ncbi:MAG: hypothetical protein ACREON_16835 [Gemmatimonadaceae bacterium]